MSPSIQPINLRGSLVCWRGCGIAPQTISEFRIRSGHTDPDIQFKHTDPDIQSEHTDPDQEF